MKLLCTSFLSFRLLLVSFAFWQHSGFINHEYNEANKFLKKLTYFNLMQIQDHKSLNSKSTRSSESAEKDLCYLWIIWSQTFPKVAIRNKWSSLSYLCMCNTVTSSFGPKNYRIFLKISALDSKNRSNQKIKALSYSKK